MSSPATASPHPVKSGIRWALGQTIVTKLLSTASYIALGWLLSDSDFGVWAAALGLAAFGQAFQDRGVREVLIANGPEAFPRLWRRTVAYSLTINVTAAGLLAIAASLLGSQQPSEYKATVWLLAIGLPLSTTWTSASAKLSMDFNFALMSKVAIVGAAIQYSLAVAFAFRGMGALSLAASLAVASLYRGLVGAFLLWRFRGNGASHRETVGLRASIGWLIVAGVGSSVMLQGDYFAASLLLPATVVGTYYFAYQLPVQLVGVLAASLQRVLLPWIAAAKQYGKDETAAGFFRASDVLTLAIGLASTFLVVSAPILERLLWGGAWAKSVETIQFLSLCMPFRAVLEPAKAVTLAHGRFRHWAGFSVVLGGAVAVGAFLGAVVGGTPLALGIGVGLATAISVSTFWISVARGFTRDATAATAYTRLMRIYASSTGGAWLFFGYVLWGHVTAGPNWPYLLPGIATVTFAALMVWRTAPRELDTILRVVRFR